ncbi:MAG: transposase domain-containing protein [Hyphomicrobiales bacterium]|nr:transposase domain-containing protein [Hyphomicrobiales bacterium]
MAIANTLIETAKFDEADPQVWLTDFINRIADHKISRIGACCRGIIFQMNNSTTAYRVFGPH